MKQPECWIDFRPGSQFSYLTHRKIKIAVRTELLTPLHGTAANQDELVELGS